MCVFVDKLQSCRVFTGTPFFEGSELSEYSEHSVCQWNRKQTLTQHSPLLDAQ